MLGFAAQPTALVSAKDKTGPQIFAHHANKSEINEKFLVPQGSSI
jgi:hypothetical protein